MKTYNVLFICTGNSARSILAEALANHTSSDAVTLRGFSAGSHPKGAPNPFALELIRERGWPADGYRSKSWDEFAAADAPAMDLIFTVCDQAAAEACPYWPGHPATAHWGLPDPAAVDGSDEDKRTAFREACSVLERRIALLIAVLAETLDEATLDHRLQAIGRA